MKDIVLAIIEMVESRPFKGIHRIKVGRHTVLNAATVPESAIIKAGLSPSPRSPVEEAFIDRNKQLFLTDPMIESCLIEQIKTQRNSWNIRVEKASTDYVIELIIVPRATHEKHY